MNLQGSDNSTQSDDGQQLFIQEMGAFPANPSIQDAVFEKDHGILSFYTEDSANSVQQFYVEQLQSQGWNLDQQDINRDTWIFDKPDGKKDWQGRTISTSVSIQIMATDMKTYVEITMLTKIQELPFK